MANNSSGYNRTTAWFIVGFIVVVTAAVIIAGALSSNSGGTAATNSDGFVSSTAPAITSSDHVIGNPNAKVTLIEYGDFECPACGDYESIVQQIINNDSSSLLFVFRNYPLTSIHPFAMVGSEAAEAAGVLGGPSKYWEMHNLLYTKQTEWSTNGNLTPAQVVSQYLNGYAQSIGLDVAQFDAAMNSKQVSDKIQSDITGGNQAQLNHTPTFFVNLQQIPNPTSASNFENAISQAISAAGGSAPSAAASGTPSTIVDTSTQK